MIRLSPATHQRIAKLRVGKEQLRLTLGVYHRGRTEAMALDYDGCEVDPSLHYALGSITKTFTTALLAKLVDAGGLDIEAPLDRYLGGLPPRYYPSLRRLAVHASGYSGIAPYSPREVAKMMVNPLDADGALQHNPYHDCLTPAGVVDWVRDHKVYDFDYPYVYNNFAYGVLGQVLGERLGTSYWDAMSSFISDEVGLAQARLGDNIPRGHLARYDINNWIWDDQDPIAAAGALCGTVDDLLRYAAFQLDPGNRYLEVTHVQHGLGKRAYSIGLGWRLDRQVPVIWHDGHVSGHSTFVGFHKEYQAAAVVLCNYAFTSVKPLGFALLRDALRF